MANRDELLTDIFKKTTQAPAVDNSDLDKGNIRPCGIGLRGGEITALDTIAAELGVARNALMRLGVRRLIVDYRAGAIDLAELVEEKPKIEPKRRLKLPT